MSSPRRTASRLGFTLIEILSVVALLALVAAFVVPNLGAYRSRALRAEAEQLASQLEFGRQRAIVTGIPHRLWLDLEGSAYRLEWLAVPDDAEQAPATAYGEPEYDLRGNAPISLEAPRAAERSFQPVPGMFGRLRVLEAPFVFDGLETPQGYVSRGEASVVFDRDGTASYTEIYLGDGEGDVDGVGIALDIFPLDERVRVRHDDV